MLDHTMRAACHILTCSLLAWCAFVPAGYAGEPDDRASDASLTDEERDSLEPELRKNQQLIRAALDDRASSKSLTDEDKQKIREAVGIGVKWLGSQDVALVTLGRKDLSRWSGGNATPVFRGEFSKVACGPLGDLVLRTADEPFQAVNAIEVLRVVRTHEALQLLAKLGSSATMPNVGIRLAATRALQASIEAGTDMNSAQADGLVRAITDATKREGEWACSYSQLTALSAIAKRNGMDAKVVAAARAGQVAGLAVLASKVSKGDPKDAQLMKSASRVLAAMRKELANAPTADRSVLSGTLLPVVDSLGKAAASPPAGLDAEVAVAWNDTKKAADLMAELLKSSGKPASKPAGKPAPNPAPKPAPKKPAN